MDASAEILLIDDKPERGERIRQSLEQAKIHLPFVQIARVAEFMSRSDGAKPAIILQACDSLSSEYLAAVRQIKQKVPDVPLLVYTEKFREITRLRSLELGADELVPEETLPKDIILFLPEAAGGTSGTAQGTAEAAAAETKGQMYFQLNGNDLSNALQFLCMTSRMGQLMLTFDSEEKGSIFLDRNTVIHAEFGKATGVQALAMMLGQGQTEALFLDGKGPPQITNDRTLSQILIEASVMADELRDAGKATDGEAPHQT